MPPKPKRDLWTEEELLIFSETVPNYPVSCACLESGSAKWPMEGVLSHLDCTVRMYSVGNKDYMR